MKRRLLMLLALAVAGAIVNVAVASSLLLTVLHCFSPALFQEATTRPVNPPARRPAAGTPNRDFYLPAAMSRDFLDRSADILRLSVEQRAAADGYFDEYGRQQQALAKAELPALLSQSAAVAAAQRSQGFDALLTERTRVVSLMVAIDEMSFTSLEQILADDQRARLKRVRDIRHHEMARVIRSRVPGSNEDVSRLVLEICEADVAATVDSDRLEVISSEYDAAAASLWKAHERRMLDAFMLEYELFGPSMDPMAAEANQRALERAQDFRADTFRLEERLRVLNVDFIRNAHPLLSDNAGALLRLRYYSSAFPEVYPDPHDVTAVLTCLETAKAGDSTLATAIAALRDGYSQRHSAISNQMIERHLAWSAWLRIHGVNDHAAFDAYKDSMLALQAERAAAAHAVLSQALDAAGPVPDSCVMVLSDYREQIANHRPQVSGFQLRP